MVRPPRFELGTPGLEGRCSIHLSYGRVLIATHSVVGLCRGVGIGVGRGRWTRQSRATTGPASSALHPPGRNALAIERLGAPSGALTQADLKVGSYVGRHHGEALTSAFRASRVRPGSARAPTPRSART